MLCKINLNRLCQKNHLEIHLKKFTPEIIALYNSHTDNHITADQHQFNNYMFSVISGQYWFVFSVNFNNTTCIWNKTTRVLKLWWMCVQKSHAIWKIPFILWYEAVNKSDTGSGCKPQCNEVSRDQRRRDAENDSRVYDALTHILFEQWVRFKRENILLWSVTVIHRLSFHTHCWSDCKHVLCVCETHCPLLERFSLMEKSLHLFVWPHQYFSSSDNTESDATKTQTK